MRNVIYLALFSAFVLLAIGCTGNGYRVYAVQYAHSTAVPADRLIAGAAGEAVDMSWYFLVAKGNGKVILIDAGSTYFEKENPNPNYFKTFWKVDSHRSVTAALAKINVKPADVTDIWVTHWHWDHFEGIREFPNAHVYMPGAEWDDARAAYATDFTIQAGWVPSILPVMDQIEAQHRLHRLTPATAKIMFAKYPFWPQLDGAITEAGKHTNHSSVIALRCPSSEIFYLAGDAAYTYRNLEQHVAVAATTDPVANVADMRKLLEVAHGTGHVLPGHDPLLFTRFPSAGDGVALICP